MPSLIPRINSNSIIFRTFFSASFIIEGTRKWIELSFWLLLSFDSAPCSISPMFYVHSLTSYSSDKFSWKTANSSRDGEKRAEWNMKVVERFRLSEKFAAQKKNSFSSFLNFQIRNERGSWAKQRRKIIIQENFEYFLIVFFLLVFCFYYEKIFGIFKNLLFRIHVDEGSPDSTSSSFSLSTRDSRMWICLLRLHSIAKEGEREFHFIFCISIFPFPVLIVCFCCLSFAWSWSLQLPLLCANVPNVSLLLSLALTA